MGLHCSTGHTKKSWPDIRRDQDLLSFRNGVLLLSEARFVSNDSDDMEALQGRVARHHIPLEFTGSKDTPLLDAMMSHQFNENVQKTVYILMGRLLFPVGDKDNWQVAPLIMGAAGTGKSVLLDVITSMFSPPSIGVLANNHEQVFGLANFVNKEIIVGRDLPQQMSKVLEQELLQSMVTGEGLSVPRKGQDALHLNRWSIPIVLASNHVPDYTDNAGQIYRRVVYILYKNRVANPDGSLLERIKIEELPAVIYKAVSAYLDAVKEHGRSRLFWEWCPKEVRDMREEVSRNNNLLKRFLSLDPEEEDANYEDGGWRTTFIVSNDPTWSTAYKHVSRVYNEFCTKYANEHGLQNKKTTPLTEEALLQLGFEVKDKQRVCRHCHRHKVRANCCDDYIDRDSCDVRNKVVMGLHVHVSRRQDLDDDVVTFMD